jgi:hypothetical protein
LIVGVKISKPMAGATYTKRPGDKRGAATRRMRGGSKGSGFWVQKEMTASTGLFSLNPEL